MHDETVEAANGGPRLAVPQNGTVQLMSEEGGSGTKAEGGEVADGRDGVWPGVLVDGCDATGRLEVDERNEAGSEMNVSLIISSQTK